MEHNVKAVIAPGIYLLASDVSHHGVRRLAGFIAQMQYDLQLQVIARLRHQKKEPDEVCLDLNMN